MTIKQRIISTLRRHCPGLFPQVARAWQSFNGWWRYGDANFPRAFTIEISTFCNRTCSYCPNSTFKTPRDEMDLTAYRAVLARLEEIRWNGIVEFIAYNEPLLHSDIVKMVEICRGMVPRCLPRIITNGDPLTVELAGRLIKAGVVAFWVSRHVPVKPGWDQRIAEVSRAYPGFITVVDLMEVQAKQGLHNRAGLVKVDKLFQADACYAQKSCQSISITGEALLCCNDYHRKYSFGNVIKEGIMPIWRSPRYRKIRDELHRGVTTLPICQNCIVKQR